MFDKTRLKLLQQTEVISEQNEVNSDVGLVSSALKNPDVSCIAMISPTIRVVWGEAYGLSPEIANGTMLVAMLHALGFSKVYNTASQASASVRMMVDELRAHIAARKSGIQVKAILSATCPDWKSLVNHYHPDLENMLSKVGSPSKSLTEDIKQQAEAQSIAKLLLVTVTGCLSKKPKPKDASLVQTDTDNGVRSPFASAHKDIRHIPDKITITTIELAKLMLSSGIEPMQLVAQDFDAPYDGDNGFGAMVSAAGGVAEALVRELLPGIAEETLAPLKETSSFKEINVSIDGEEIKLAAANGLEAVSSTINKLKENPQAWDFVEMMTCESSCVDGMGQPRADQERIIERTQALRALAL